MAQKSDNVRHTRAGDQFHYRWAARRCLGLIDPGSSLACITIEGVSSDETSSENNGTGEEVVDIAEYYGDRRISHASKISYHQLKHSYQTVVPWTLSALRKTLAGFYKRYQVFLENVSNENNQTVEFTYITNRPVATGIHDLFGRIKQRSLEPTDAEQWAQIKRYIGTDDDSLALDFLANFRIDDTNEAHWKQRSILIEELSGYIVGSDKEVADQLWRLVIDKALPQNANNPEITREDVLRFLNTDEDELFPAPCLIEEGEAHFAREQEDDFWSAILAAEGRPVIIHAEGGVGKSAIANKLRRRATDHSVAILYDCFGNGEYRTATERRDEHRVALVQMANELASLQLCHPLIPSPHARPEDYLRAFRYRLKQSIEILRGYNPDARLVLLIDAADNAEMAAEEYQERASFAKDLIRQKLPGGVECVFLCRSHRINKLDPPGHYIDLVLRSFSQAETERLLLNTFPEATTHDVREFHRITSQNPRVQATAMSRGLSLSDTLLMLGPNPTTVEDTIRNIFAQSIAQLIDRVPKVEAQQLQALCEAMAALRPFIPIDVLSLVSGLDKSAIRSFIVDLGRPLSLVGEAVQFFDEPSETWFRETYTPEKAKLAAFVATIKPLALTSSYVAAALPQLMLEAGLYAELVELVLQDDDLPNHSPVERRNSSLQRLQFALKAALRKKQYEDAAKLALKAGGETAGSDRQEALIQSNTDLISHLLPAHRLREIVAQKSFSVSWHGGHHAYEACLLSGCAETLAESRSYLRLSHRWVHSWARLSKSERKKQELSDADIAEIALCQLYLNGPKALVDELQSWRPRSVAFRVGSIVFKRLVDLGEHVLISAVAKCSLENPCILFAAINAEARVLKYLDAPTVKAAFDGLKKYHRQIRKYRMEPSYEEPILSVVNSLVQSAVVQGAAEHLEIASVLDLYIPPPERYYFGRHSDEPRFTLVRAVCLRAALRGQSVEVLDFAKPEVKKQLEKDRNSQTTEAREFNEDIGAVLAWHKLWVRALLGQVEPTHLDQAIELCHSEYRKGVGYYTRDDRFTSKEISRLWLETLLMTDPTAERIDRFIQWKDSLKQRLFTPALTRLTQLCANSKIFAEYAYDFAQEAFDIIDQDRMDAEQKVETYIEIARAIFTLSPPEAEHYFDKAVEVAGRIGQENLDRWSSFLELASAAAKLGVPQPELTYRLSRAAEVVYAFVARDKHFDWEGTIDALVSLCPASSLAILSRWKDRSFGWENRIFPHAIEQLVKSTAIDPRAALALIGFQYHWPAAAMVQAATAAADHAQERRALFERSLRYIAISEPTPKDLEELEALAKKNGWSDFDFEDLKGRARSSQEREQRRNSSPHTSYESKPDPPKEWDDIFENLDVSSSESVQSAYRRFRAGSPPFYVGQFATEFFGRVPRGAEPNALKAIFSVSDFDLYEFRGLFEAVPSNWVARNHIRRSLRTITEEVCKANFYEIAKSRYYQALPYEVIARCTGINERQIYAWVVEASAENPLILGSGRLFSLVGLIAPTLDAQQAAAALTFGLQLLEVDMTEQDGDGDWSPKLRPPDETVTSLAGYIWVALGSPQTPERWQAAHVVGLLCAFERLDILEPLSLFANGTDSAPFHDVSLPFYNLSAKLWLLIALRRALKLGGSKSVLRFENFIRLACCESERHLMLRGISADILLALHEHGSIELSRKESDRLRAINVSKHELLISDAYQRDLVVSTPRPEDDEREFYFSYDISRYWFESLGRIFAFGPKEIEHRATRFLREDMGIYDQGGAKGDPRHHRRLYGDYETTHSHGSYPQAEDLSFYHSYHSMMVVAGELIDTVQRHQHSEYSDEFVEWIARHEITRSDGLWLADRRDPVPTEAANWKSQKEDDAWRFSITKNDLLDALRPEEDGICVWGSWNHAEGDQEEHITISSALVNSDRGHSLLRALQTIGDPHGYRIPPSGNDLEIDFGQYQLKGWIWETSREHGIDERDPWAGDVGYPPIRPAKWFSDLVGLHSDSERRLWRTSSDDQPVLRSRAWGRKSTKNEFMSPEIGSRMVANEEALTRWLSPLGMNIILEVQIRRDFRRDSYRRRQEESSEYLPPYTLVVLIDAEGRIETL
ncbi:MAG TPA: ATP-binding protein [Rhizobiaceae bacterium]|nr:ATP-binding protein [Rhizobiaceae bacterium]